MKSLLLILLRIYKIAISPLLGQHCRFFPSCSEYAQQAVVEHGALRGSALACQRLCKCHPWHAGGIDLVPKRKLSNEVANVADHVTRSHP